MTILKGRIGIALGLKAALNRSSFTSASRQPGCGSRPIKNSLSLIITSGSLAQRASVVECRHARRRRLAAHGAPEAPPSLPGGDDRRRPSGEPAGGRGHAPELVAEIDTLDPAVGLKQLRDRYAAATLWIEVDDPGAVEDVDTPEDYRQLTGGSEGVMSS
jgi:hypothetical protein